MEKLKFLYTFKAHHRILRQNFNRCSLTWFVSSSREVPSFGLYILSYDRLYDFMVNNNLTDKNAIIASIVAGGTAGCLTWLSIMPFDVIKSRLQVGDSLIFLSHPLPQWYFPVYIIPKYIHRINISKETRIYKYIYLWKTKVGTVSCKLTLRKIAVWLSKNCQKLDI